MMIPIARALAKAGWELHILALTTAAAPMRSAGFDVVGFSNLMELAAPGAEAFGAMLCKGMVDGPVALEETRAYHGVNFAELVERHGLEGASAAYARDGRQAFYPIAFLKAVIAHFQPDVVVATNSPRSERAAIDAARQMNVPSVCMVDMFALQEAKWIGLPGFADRVCVLNDQVRDMFLRLGRKPGEVVVTGNPAFDSICDPATIAAGAALKQERGWDDGLLNILWASQVEPRQHPFTSEPGDPGLPRKIEAGLRHAVTENPQLRLIVRYHPSETVQFEPAPRVEFSPTTEPLHSLLHAVDVVCVTASTVGVEAWIAGKPVMSVDCSIFTADAPFATMGISEGYLHPDDLVKKLSKLTGKDSKLSLSGAPSSTTNALAACDAVVATIEQLASERPEFKC